MTSQEKVRQLVAQLGEWAASNEVPGGVLIAGMLAGMAEQFDDVLPESPAELDRHLAQVAQLLLNGRSDEAAPMAIHEWHPHEADEYDCCSWKPASLD